MKLLAAACVVFCVLGATPVLLARLPDGTRGAATMALFLGLSVAGVVAVVAFRPTTSSIRLVMLTAIAARALATLAPPFTSNDIDRYLWDGHLALSGIDPWQVTPLGAGLSDWPLPPDNQSISSLYPPGAMAMFGLAALGGPGGGLWLWKLFIFASNLGLLRCAWLFVRDTLNARWLPLVALSPLLVIEGGVGAHLDVLAALPLMVALLALRRQWFARAGLLIGVGALLKILPLVALVPIAAAHGLRAAVRAGASAAAVIGVGYGVPLVFGLRPFGSLVQFFGHWRFGTPVALVERLGGATAALIAGAVVFASFLCWSVLRARRQGVEAGLSIALLAPLAASPVAFPWYLVPLAATAATRPTATVFLWTTLAPLTYEVIDGYRRAGEFAPAAWPLWVTSLGLVVGVLLDLAWRPIQETEAA